MSRFPAAFRTPVRYAVVGAGHIAQNAVLPAFDGAGRNSVLTAVFSGDSRKRTRLRRLYRLEWSLDYSDFDQACEDDLFDAVYIALPNHLHREFACRASARGRHVLCEKPMAVDPQECRAMIRAARAADVRLMVAYRLHFEAANLRAIQLARREALGDLRTFSSVFSMQVRSDNVRLARRAGGGPLFDLGIYCINAARCLFGDEPVEAVAMQAGSGDGRFQEVEETTSALLRFPGERLAQFTCSFGQADVSQYQLVGTRGKLRLDPAYEYESPLRLELSADGHARTWTYPRRDQFAAELLYFSGCIRSGREPEPGGNEGLNDVCIIDAIQTAAQTGRSEAIRGTVDEPQPSPAQRIRRDPPRKRELVHAQSAHVD